MEKLIYLSSILGPVWPEENRQMTIKVAKNEFTRKMKDLPRNVGDLGKLIAAKGFKKVPKVQKIAKSGHLRLILFEAAT